MPEPTVFNGRYELHRRLGRGGMAEVFLARDLQLDRPVAVKVLFTEFANDPAFVARFRREARAAANLNHPNIVSVFDWGQEHGTYFIVMEYVEGQTLAEMLRAGTVPPERAVDIATDVAAALGHAHAAGVLHRDIKPGNILVTASGRVKVADWGIGRAMDAAAEENLTQTGAVMGTATYFSPEQAQGLSLDPRSDLYSLGVVLYESLAGRPPFQGDSPVAIAYKHVQEQPVPPRSLNLDVPPDLEAIVLHLLAKNPAARYPSADALRDDLRRYRDGAPVAASARAVGAAGAAAAPPAATTAVPVVEQTRAVTVPPQGPPAEYQPAGREPRSWLFLVVLLVLLGILAVLLFFLAQMFDDGDGDGEDVAQVEVPLVVDLQFEVAEQQLSDLGLEVDRVDEEITDPARVGIVLTQDPEHGIRIDEGATVTLTVGTQNLLPLPDVSELTPDDALALLQENGFTGIPRQQPEDSEDVDEGLVIRTEPPAGEQVAEDAVITLFVSSGPPAVAVPDVTGHDCDINAAFAELSEAGFVPQQRQAASSDVDDGCIIGTDPPAGTQLDEGETVFVVVSSGPATADVPSVVGLSEGAARQALEDAGFLVDVQRRPAEGGEEPGEVVDQEPTGSQEVGTTVTIVVADQPETTTTTTLPDVGD